jgi:hypothetical protein
VALGLLALALLALPPSADADQPERQDWFLTVFVGPWLDERLLDILSLDASAGSFRPSYAAGVGLGREVWRPLPRTSLEIEGQVVQHVGRQSHPEANLALIARLDLLPAAERLGASIAIGEGVSVAGRRPPIEAENDRRSTRLLNYLMLELELDPVPASPWSALGRIHHRSGVLGTFAGVRGGSNFVMLGLRYRP